MIDLELKHLTKTYGTTKAVDDVNLAVGAGELVAFLGPSGCGKTTTLRMVAGFIEPTAGTILVRGNDITELKPNHRDMGMVFQSYALFPHMTVERNIAFGLVARGAPRAEIAPKVGAALDLVGLAGFGDRYPKQLSGGQQQRVALARVLALKPKLLLFDEPLSNLDAKLRVQMRHEIRQLQKEVGITSLFVTHDQEEAMTIADRIAVMSKGRINQIGTPAEIYDRPSTRFVADFIGTSNLIDGRVVDGRFVARSGLVLPSTQASDGEAVLSIRPEKVELADAGAQDAISGKVTRVTKLGGLIEYATTLPSGETFLIHQQDRSGNLTRALGDDVALSWRPEDSRLLTT
ncbi:MAG: ABC transporter ATP-binding protein [Hyphomicrobiaceae bacterium]